MILMPDDLSRPRETLSRAWMTSFLESGGRAPPAGGQAAPHDDNEELLSLFLSLPVTAARAPETEITL